MASFYATYGAGTAGGGGGGSGNVVGPASATDKAIVRFDGTTGKLIQNSNAVLDDSGNVGFQGTMIAGQVIDSGLTVNTVPYTDSSKQFTSSAVTPTELGYVSGVTSAIQTQLNGKQATLTTGNLTDAGTDGITIGNGSGSVLGTGTTISQHVADTTHNGYLSSADWNTFNGKQAAGSYLTALTGDVTASGPGSAAATLATVNTNIGTFASVTLNGKGLATAGAALSGDATTSGPALTLATVNTNVGSFTNANITVNGKGLVTAAANGSTPLLATATKSANYTLTSTDSVIFANPSGAFTLTLPTAVGISGKVYYTKKIANDFTNIVTIATTSSQTIDGYASVNLSTYNEDWELVSDGANWQVLSHKTVTPWKTYTLVIQGTTTNPTPGSGTTISAWWRRIGDSMEIISNLAQTSNSGSAVGSGNYLWPLPSGPTIDTGKANTSTSNGANSGTMIGIANVGNTLSINTANTQSAYMQAYTTSALAMVVYTDTDESFLVSSTNFQLNAPTLYYSFRATVPIVGWYE